MPYKPESGGGGGTPGPAGPAGADGAQGRPGVDGPEGDEGPQGPPGNTGPQGAAGGAGAQGVAGVTGAAGPPGYMWDDPDEGPQGPPGVAGATGTAGSNGSPGAAGAAGLIGPPGMWEDTEPAEWVMPPGTPERPAATATPTTSALGDAAAVGTGITDARADHKHGRESFATNAVLLGSAAAAGAATTPMRSNDTIAAFDATVPTTQAFADAAAVGVINFAARRDHKHAMMVKEVYRTAAVASVTGYSADTYLAGSGVTITANQPIAGSSYKLIFDVTKTNAGIAAPVIIVRFGTAGSTADAARITFTFSAQTAVVDSGTFEIYVTFQSVGAAGVARGIAVLRHQLAVTGLNTVQPAGFQMLTVASAGFDTTTPTRIGVSVNGGASASWTTTLVQAEFYV